MQHKNNHITIQVYLKIYINNKFEKGQKTDQIDNAHQCQAD